MAEGLIIIVLVITVGVLIAALILRAAVTLYNSMAGSSRTPDAIPEPSIGKAMGIIVVASLANAVAGYTIDVLMGGGGGGAAAGRPGAVNPTAQLISLPVGVLVMAGMLAAMLPTSFMRALIVTILYYVVAVVIAVAIGFTVYMLFQALR